MAKQGMKRPERTHTKERNEANPLIAGEEGKVYHSKPHTAERPISEVYPVIDTDLARDNLENDLSSADLQDL